MKTVKNNLCDDGLAPHEHTVATAGLQWHTLEWGTGGTPLVLWHGITSNARGWWRLGPLLASLGFHVWAPDLPGHGASGDTQSYAAADTARLLDGWLHALGLEQPVIVGHSWGGMNALVHATLPEMTVSPRAVVLLDPAIWLGSDPESAILAYSAGLGIPRSDAVCAEIATANPRWHACDVWWKALAREQARPAAVEGFFRHNAGCALLPQLGQIPVPVYLQLADPERGGIWPLATIEEVRAWKLPHVTVEMIEHGTHNLHRDAWVPFSMALGRWLRHTALR